MNDIVQIISTVGFPIACVLGMAWYINTTHKEMTDAINNSTKAIEYLSKIIERLEEKIDD